MIIIKDNAINEKIINSDRKYAKTKCIYILCENKNIIIIT